MLVKRILMLEKQEVLCGSILQSNIWMGCQSEVQLLFQDTF